MYNNNTHTSQTRENDVIRVSALILSGGCKLITCPQVGLTVGGRTIQTRQPYWTTQAGGIAVDYMQKNSQVPLNKGCTGTSDFVACRDLPLLEGLAWKLNFGILAEMFSLT